MHQASGSDAAYDGAACDDRGNLDRSCRCHDDVVVVAPNSKWELFFAKDMVNSMVKGGTIIRGRPQIGMTERL